MTRYEERLEADLSRIRHRLKKMSRAVCTAIDDAVQSMLNRNPELASDTVLGDLPINRRARELDHLCHLFVARHLPSAGHLRFTTSVMRLSKTLERIGDYAATMSREVHQMSHKVPETISDDITMLADQARKVLEPALRSFIEEDIDLARSTRSLASQYGTTFDRVFKHLTRAGETKEVSIGELFALLTVCNRLERVIHQSKNIAEQTIFALTGEQKEEKTFDILFLGLQNDCASLIAEYYGQRAYPEAGSFSSAGWQSVDAISQDVLDFADSKGLDLREAESHSFDEVKRRLSEFEIVIDLTGEARENIRKIPFHTTLLVWNLDRSGGQESIYQDLVEHMAELMETLRGEEAED
jgi:phosphate transport system protein